jgi:multidrug efflux pump subunit AcrA (membrane-fusion protein)
MPRKNLLIAALLVLLSACAKKETAAPEAPAPVQVTAVTQNTIRRTVAGDGALYPLDQANVMPKLAAPVQKFYVNRGDHVKQGQLLAVLENRDLIAAAAESKGGVDQAESNFRATQGATVPEAVVKAQTDLDSAREARDAAKKVVDSREQLFKQGALAGKLLDDAQVAYAQASSQFRAADEHLKALQSVSKEEQIKGAAAQVQTAKSHYDSQEAQVAYSRIVSPINGVIADRPLNVGEMANPGSPLISVMDISHVIARINVPEADATAVKVGQRVVITQPDKGEEIEGKVKVVSPAADANTTTLQVWVDIPNPGEQLKPGTSVHARIVAEEFKAATVVPAAAILPGEEGGTAALTVGSDSTVHRKTVKLGVREGNQVQILSGLTPGDEVVVVGGLGLDDKAKVKVITTAVEEADDEDEDNAPPEPAATPNKNKAEKKDQAAPKGK